MDTPTTDVPCSTEAAGGAQPSLIAMTTFCIYYAFVLRVVLPVIVMVGGLFGNGLTVVVFWKERSKSATALTLICLAVSDSFLLIAFTIFGTPSSTLRFMGRELEAQNFGNEILAWLGGAGPTTIMLSMGFTVTVTWQRYVSACLPYKAKTYGSVRTAKILAVVVVLTAVLFNIPRWVEQEVVYDGSRAILVYTPLGKDVFYTYFHGIALYYTVFYIAPMIALAYMTFHLIKALKESQRKRDKMTNHLHTKVDRGLTKSLVIVVAVFIVCQSLSPIRRLLMSFYKGPTVRQCGGVFFYYEAVSVLINMFNSAINFVIYVLFVKRFRSQIAKMFCLRRKRQVAPFGADELPNISRMETMRSTVA